MANSVVWNLLLELFIRILTIWGEIIKKETKQISNLGSEKFLSSDLDFDKLDRLLLPKSLRG
jgi:hypothetical protein